MEVRPLGAQDFLPALACIDAWFGETVHEPVHPVMFHHIGGYAVDDDDRLIGFLIGFRSHTNKDVAYIHLVAIDPERRGQGIATNLYGRFERQARVWGCTMLEAVTHPANTRAIRFHEDRGFWTEVAQDWAGPGHDRVVMRKKLELAY